jgi:hypothetical protein
MNKYELKNDKSYHTVLPAAKKLVDDDPDAQRGNRDIP